MALTEEQIELMMDPYGTRKYRLQQRAKAEAIAEAKALAEQQAVAQAAANKPRVGYSNTANRAGNMNVRDADYIPFNQYMQLKRMAEKYPDNSATPGIIANMEKSGKVEFDPNNIADMEATRIKSNNNTVPVAQDEFGGGDSEYDYYGNRRAVTKIMNDPKGFLQRQMNKKSTTGTTQRFGQDNTGRIVIDDEIGFEEPTGPDMADLKPDWGANPGFHKNPGANFWTADNDSGFWQTDAGVDKARETWGEGSLPSFVKQPKQKEIDIQGIKNWFSENWGK